MPRRAESAGGSSAAPGCSGWTVRAWSCSVLASPRTRDTIRGVIPPRRYVLVLDESGRRTLAEGDRRAFVFGGFVIPEEGITAMHERWPGICESYGPPDGGEMKARDFRERLAAEHGEDEADDYAQAILSMLLRAWDALPIVVLVDRTSAGSGVCKPTRKGTQALDQPLLASSLLTGFGQFLTRKQAFGRVCMDQLTSDAEHAAVRESVASVRAMSGKVEVHRIDAEPTFAVSRDTPEVQLADVVVGTLARPYEQRVAVVDGLSSLLREAQSLGLGVIHVK